MKFCRACDHFGGESCDHVAYLAATGSVDDDHPEDREPESLALGEAIEAWRSDPAAVYVWDITYEHVVPLAVVDHDRPCPGWEQE